MDKKYPGKCSFGIRWNFIEKNNFFGKIFVIFEFFSNSEAWLKNDLYMIFQYFLDFLTPNCVCIEMGNLEAKTPCVEWLQGKITLHTDYIFV